MGQIDQSVQAQKARCPVVHWEFGEGPLPVPAAHDRMKRFGPDQRIVRVDEAQGYYLVTDQELTAEVLRDPSRFSNSAVIPIEPDPPYAWIPLMVDPPQHTAWRLLAPYFTPKQAEGMSDAIRRRCADIIDGFIEEERPSSSTTSPGGSRRASFSNCSVFRTRIWTSSSSGSS